MEEIINKLIDIDKMSKSIVNEQNIRKENIDDLIEMEIEKQKTQIDANFELKLKLKNEEISRRLEENKQRLLEKEKSEIEKIEKQYNDLKEQKINKIINEIIG